MYKSNTRIEREKKKERERREERERERYETAEPAGSPSVYTMVLRIRARTALFSSKQCNHNSAFSATSAMLPYRLAKSTVDQRILVWTQRLKVKPDVN